MVEGFSKERHIASIKEVEAVKKLMIERGKEIVSKVPEGIDIGVKGCDNVYADDYYSSFEDMFRYSKEDSKEDREKYCKFYISERIPCRYEDDWNVSIKFPIEALYSDEALEKFFEKLVEEKEAETAKKKKAKEAAEAAKEAAERKEYERLKAKFEKELK